MADDINVTVNNLYLFVPKLIPSVETQLMFDEASQNNYKKSYAECFTERRVVFDLLVQYDIGLSQQMNSPRCLISAHQTKDRILTANKNNNIAIFDNLDRRN